MDQRTTPSLSVVVPAYNEADSLREFFPRLVEFCESRGYRVVIVDDGSGDDTAEVLAGFADRPAVQIVSNKVNRGYGGALKAGIDVVETDYLVTIDADGQHDLDDVVRLHEAIVAEGADMIVGNRERAPKESLYRKIGKRLIRGVARILLTFHIRDLNSGMKIYDAGLARRYVRLCPDSMAFSDIITLVFISQRHLVLERPIRVHPRAAGTSTINTMTALDTLREIVNIVVLFNPMKIFFPLAAVFTTSALAWGLPIVLQGRGVSVGALLGFLSGMIFFLLGLLAEQLALIRKGAVVDRP